jgi:hypothetical protein
VTRKVLIVRNTPIQARQRTPITPKALANSSPGLERQRQPWVKNKVLLNPEKGSAVGEPLFRVVNDVARLYPRFSLHSNLGLELANAFAVIGKKVAKCTLL